MRRGAFVGSLVVAIGVVALVAVMPRHVFDGLLDLVLLLAACMGIVCGVLLIVSVRDILRRRRLVDGGDLKTAKRVARGKGLSLDALAKRVGTTSDALRGASCSYREVQIPKRRGGTRRLLIPDDVTKAMQRRILRRVLGGLRAHAAATGFERGKSIVENALPHCESAVVIRMDVVDFFTSTKSERVLRYFQWVGWGREAAEILTRLTTHEGGLPQGAPTSPRLSNLVNYYLDVQIANEAAWRDGAYTRYADDITISLPRPNGRRVRGMIQHARRILAKHGYRLHTRRKLHVARRHQRQVVTGLVVNQRVRLPREIRRRLRATRHQMEKGLPPKQGAAVAQGWFAYEAMVESRAAAAATEGGASA